MVRNDAVMSNYGVPINLATFTNYSTGWALGKGTNHPPSCLNLEMAVWASNIKPISYQEAFSFGGFHDQSYFDTEEFRLARDKADNELFWLWGDVEHGGCYIRKGLDNKYYIGGVTGFFHRLSNDKYIYLMMEGSNRPFTKLNDICFLYEDTTVENEFPVLTVWSMEDMRLIPESILPPEQQGAHKTYFGKGLYNALLFLYTHHDTTSMYDVTRYITWEGSLGDKASCYWYPAYGGTITYPYPIFFEILGMHTMDDYEWIGGNIWGGQLIDPDEEPTDPNDLGGYSSGGSGGNGSYPSETGDVDFSDPTQMTVNAVSSGFISLYNPTASEMRDFNSWLFNDVTDAMSNVMKRLIANPVDYVLFIALCHFTPPSTAQDAIHFAGINTNVTANKINNQFCEVDCGSVYIDGDTQTFLDYNNFTKISIFLPYIGIQALNCDDVIGSNVHIKYYIDMLSGGCICQIRCTRGVRNSNGDARLNDVLYSFSGNCYEQIPFTGTDWRGMVTSLMQIVGGAVSLASGNLAGLGSIASGVISDKVSVQKSGNMSASYGYMDNQKPYIILERPINNNPYNFRGFKGYTLNAHMNLSHVKGYTEIDEDCLWVDNFNGISKDESELLKSILQSGVYF